jgi:hypothetical protein
MADSLCETCRHVREVHTPRSRFLLCERSLTDPNYPKYPRQPVVRCPGYRAGEETGEPEAGDPAGGRS